MFFDRAVIRVKGGAGGHGCVAFRREKGVPRGGPAGGDGGRGGSVVLRAEPSLSTLIDFQYRPLYEAGRGQLGMGSRCNGRDAEDVVVRVPLGTLVKEAGTGRVLGDLTEAGQTLVVARGGRGGRGNQHFATSTRRAPAWAEPGEPGEERTLELELRLIADAGLVGLPNAGKSLLLTKVSAARPKVADYPFTTLEPHLGVVRLGVGESYVLADLPGLIEGAHRGVGLGHDFLRHVSRTRVLAHVVDVGTERDLAALKADHDLIVSELERYDPSLLERPRLLVGNKTDLHGAMRRYDALARHAKARGAVAAFPVSALTGAGIPALLRGLQRALRDAPAPVLHRPDEEPATLAPAARAKVRVVRDQRGAFLVRGRELERLTAGLDPKDESALGRLQADFARLGVERALVRAGVRKGDVVRIGPLEFEYQP